MQPAELTPIFVLGIMPRSGTNFLADLVCLHPDAARRPGIPEDFLVSQAHHLAAYCDAVFDCWPKAWGEPPAAERADLLLRLGDGLSTWLSAAVPDKRVVTKTPRISDIDLLPDLLPNACFLILVRDGRSVVESGVRSFNWHYPAAMRRWAEAARQVVAFDARCRDSGLRYRIVRYEDVAALDADYLRDLIAFTGLDPETYDVEAAQATPVRGSSDVRTAEQRPVHWQPVDRWSGFDPVRRFSRWDAARHAQYAAIAGDVHRALGYDLAPTEQPPLALRLRTVRQDKTRDLRGRGAQVRDVLRRVPRRLRSPTRSPDR